MRLIDLNKIPHKAFRGDRDDLVDALFAVQTVDAAPVIYAHWEEEPDNECHWHCSNCKTVQGVASIVMNYCPNCGAKMAEHPWAASGCGQTFSPD